MEDTAVVRTKALTQVMTEYLKVDIDSSALLIIRSTVYKFIIAFNALVL